MVAESVSLIVAHLIVQFEAGKHWIFKANVHPHDVVDESMGLVGLQGRGYGQTGSCISVQDVHQLLFLHRTFRNREEGGRELGRWRLTSTCLLPIMMALPLGSTARYCPGTIRRQPLFPNVSWWTCIEEWWYHRQSMVVHTKLSHLLKHILHRIVFQDSDASRVCSNNDVVCCSVYVCVCDRVQDESGLQIEYDARAFSFLPFVLPVSLKGLMERIRPNTSFDTTECSLPVFGSVRSSSKVFPRANKISCCLVPEKFPCTAW